MIEDVDFLRKTGLQFFGTMTASVSHELKNVLAILNENAGLMQDLTLMARKGASIDLERINSLADRFCAQINRADDIIKNLNRFAHTVDHDKVETDICDMLRLTAVLAGRFASMRGVAVESDRLPPSVSAETNPFFLIQLIWLCLDYAMDAAGEPKRVVLECRRTDSNVQILFLDLHGNTETSEKPLFSDMGKQLLHLLQAEIKLQPDIHALVVTI
ncbi:MAG: hypothetical protein R6U50_14890 [Desulfobacterales bacterium]